MRGRTGSGDEKDSPGAEQTRPRLCCPSWVALAGCPALGRSFLSCEIGGSGLAAPDDRLVSNQCDHCQPDTPPGLDAQEMGVFIKNRNADGPKARAPAWRACFLKPAP